MEPIYIIVDWTSAISYGFVIGALAMIAIMFFIGKAVYCCKKRCLNSGTFALTLVNEEGHNSKVQPLDGTLNEIAHQVGRNDLELTKGK